MRPSRRRIAVWGLIGAVFGAVAVSAASAGKLLVIDDPKPSDVIVVLAGETEHRPARALELLQQGYGRRLLLDVPSNEVIYDTPQLQIAERYVHNLRQASAVAICPIAGLSTRDESHDVEQCLKHESGKRILLVTSAFHTRRSLSTFRHELRGKTFSVVAAEDDTQFGTHWWAQRQWAKTCVDEWLRLVWWNAVERWR